MGCCGRRIKAAATPPPAPKQVEAEAVKALRAKPMSADELRKLGSVKTK